MKKMMFTLFAMLTIAASANAMSYEQAREEALFLTDKMAYELNLSDAQYEAAYEINLDYLMGVTSQYDVFGPYWERRNLDLSYILFSWQWDLFRAATYFYRPLIWDAGYWHFSIYARYPHRDYFYFGRPHFYVSYRGGHSWRMNNGHSYYEGRRDHYRPGNPGRDQHFGMRSSWDRGDYRDNAGGGPRGGRHSSTQITGGPNNPPAGGNGGYRIGDRPNGQQGGFGSGRNGNGNIDNRGRDNQPRGNFDSRSNGGNIGGGNTGGGNFGGSHGSFGGNRSGEGGGIRQGGNPGGGNNPVGGGNIDRGNTRGNVGGSVGGGSFGGSRSNGGGSVGGTRGNGGGGGSISGGNRGGGGSIGGGNRGGGGGSRGGGGGSRGSFGGSRR